MKVTPNDVQYGIFWRTPSGAETALKGFASRIAAETHADNALTVPHIIHGYIRPANER